MKQTIRRLMAVMLCAVLALASPLALAQDMVDPSMVDVASLWARLTVTLPDGAAQEIPVSTVTTTLGDIVYWVDQSTLTPEQLAALNAGQFDLISPVDGSVVAQFLMQGSEAGYVADEPLYFTSTVEPYFTVAIVFSSGMTPVPMTPEEADAALAPYGFETPEITEPEITEPEITEPEITEPEITEPEITEPEITEPEITEPEITEPINPDEGWGEGSTDSGFDDGYTGNGDYEENQLEQGDETEPEVVLPLYIAAVENETALYDAVSGLETTWVSPSDVLTVVAYEYDDEGQLWYWVTDYRTMVGGCVPQMMTVEIDEDTAAAMKALIDEELAQPETEPIQPEETEQPETELIQPEETEQPETEPIQPEETEQPETEPIQPVEPEAPEASYAVTNNKNGDINNLRNDVNNGSVVAEIPNGILVKIGESLTDDGGKVWYPVTVVQSGENGFMRDYLLTEITSEDAQNRLAQIDVPATMEEEQGESDTQAGGQPSEPIMPNDGGEEQTQEPVDQDVTYATEFPAYGITLEQSGNVSIVLRTEPNGAPPQSGAIPQITKPTPLELTAVERDENGTPWYMARNMSTDESGYIEVYKVRLVSEEEARAAIVVDEKTPIPPAPTEEEEQGEEESPSPDPVVDSTPQEMQTGDVFHYGRTTSAQVRLRKKPNGDEITKLKEGTILWVMQLTEVDGEDAWCYVRTEGKEGYIMSQYVQLMSVEEEAAYRASLDNPEEIPGESDEPTNAPTDDSGAGLITPNPEVTDEPTDAPTDEPTDTPTDEPTDAPTDTPTDEPTDTPTDTPTDEPGAAETPAPQEMKTYGRVISDGTPLRGNPDANASLTTAMLKDQAIYILQSQMGADGVTWYLAQYDGKWGYVRAEHVRLMTEQEIEAYLAELENQNATPTTQPEATPEPVGPNAMSAYAKTLKEGVNLRLEANSGGNIVGKVPNNVLLRVTKTVFDGTYDWHLVNYNGQDGYVRGDMAQLLTLGELQDYLDEQAAATPIPTATPAPQQMDAYLRVIGDNTPLRANPSDEAALQAMLARESVLHATQSEMDSNGITWYLAQFGDQWGYVRADLARVMGEQETRDYLAQQATPTVEPTQTPIPTATPAPQTLSVYARVNNDGTPLRGNPDANAYLQNILTKDTVVYIIQSQVADDGMTWYLAQYSGQWGFIRADLVRLMGEQETKDYLAQLEAELATPTPLPQATPEPIGPNAMSAYAKLIKDAVNLRRTPSASGTSLGRIPVNTLLLVTGTEYDGTYTWYQVNYNGNDGYVRSDMAQMLTIGELQAFLAEQAAATPKPGVSTTPNQNNNISHTINGTPLQDLLPTDGSWSSGTGTSMPGYATATPDPNATPMPAPVTNPARLINSSGNIQVSNVPAVSESGAFTVYGTAAANAIVTATVNVQVTSGATASPTAAPQVVGAVRFELFASAVAEDAGAALSAQTTQTVKRTVGQAVADGKGAFVMDVKLPQPGEYIVEFTSGESYAQYGVTYDTGATPEPTVQPLPTAQPVQEDGGVGIMPFVIGGLLIVVAAAVYGIYLYRRKKEEEEEDEAEEEEEDESELRKEQLMQQRSRYAQTPPTAVPGAQPAPRMPQSPPTQVPSYMRNAPADGARQENNPYAKPTAPAAPKAPSAPTMPTAPAAPKAPTMPTAPVAPKAPSAPTMPTAPKAPSMPAKPAAPMAPDAQDDSADMNGENAPRRRRRPPVDPNA